VPAIHDHAGWADREAGLTLPISVTFSFDRTGQTNGLTIHQFEDRIVAHRR
jgi:hypothetical protein